MWTWEDCNRFVQNIVQKMILLTGADGTVMVKHERMIRRIISKKNTGTLDDFVISSHKVNECNLNERQSEGALSYALLTAQAANGRTDMTASSK